MYEEIWNGDPSSPYVNIFRYISPIDNMPKGKRRLRSARFYWAKHAHSFILEYKYPSEYVKKIEQTDKEVKSYYKKDGFWVDCLIFSADAIITTKWYTSWRAIKTETGYLGIPCAIA